MSWSRRCGRGSAPLTAAAAAAVAGPIGLAHATPDPVGLTGGERVIAADGAHRALRAQLPRLLFAVDASGAALAVGGEEHRGAGAVAGPVALPVPVGGAGPGLTVRGGHGSFRVLGARCSVLGARVLGCTRRPVRRLGVETWCARRPLDAAHTTTSVEVCVSGQRKNTQRSILEFGASGGACRRLTNHVRRTMPVRRHLARVRRAWDDIADAKDGPHSRGLFRVARHRGPG